MNNNQLERYIQNFKSFGKAFYISAVIFAGVGLSNGDSIENETVKKFIGSIGLLAGGTSIAALYRNKNKIDYCLDQENTNQEIKNKYGLTGNTYFFKI